VLCPARARPFCLAQRPSDGRFDELGDELAALLDRDEAILDGEVIAADATGRPQFYDLLRGAQAPAYVALTFCGPMAGTCERCR